MKSTNVYIVGAGPGDPDLITVKGLKTLRIADVVLYDALVDPEILANCTEDCRRIYVGKRAGAHKMPQSEINGLIVAKAIKGEVVVRLKGGDPFIFGRGHEELIYAKQHGLNVEVIPGLSSVTSVPLLQSVPLTRRGISESFWVITGTCTNQKLSKDIFTAVQTTATLVILMGMRKLALIQQILIENGRVDMPMMVVQNGSRDSENYVVGTVGDILHRAKKADIAAPGIIIAGEVVRLHSAFVMDQIKYQWRA